MYSDFNFIDINTDKHYDFNHSKPDCVTFSEHKKSYVINYEILNMKEFQKEIEYDTLPIKKKKTAVINIENIKQIASLLNIGYNHKIMVSDYERKLAHTHEQVIQDMAYYIKIIRMAMNEIYCLSYHLDYDDDCLFNSITRNLFSLLKNKNKNDNNRIVYMTEKGYTLKQTPDAKIYGTVQMFIDQFCINPLYFKNGIRYDSICNCIYNLYNWIAPIIYAYAKVNIPETFIIAFYTCDNGINFIENELDASMCVSNNIDFIVKNPIDILSILKSSSITWNDIIDIMEKYGF